MTTIIEQARRGDLDDTEVYVLFSLIHDIYCPHTTEMIFPAEVSLEQKREWLGELKDSDLPMVNLLFQRCKLCATVDLQLRQLEQAKSDNTP